MDDHYVYINVNNSTIFVTKLYKPIKSFIKKNLLNILSFWSKI